MKYYAECHQCEERYEVDVRMNAPQPSYCVFCGVVVEHEDATDIPDDEEYEEFDDED